MKSNKLVSLIKEVVKQEVKKQITDILINETNIPKAKPVIKKKKVKEQQFTSDPTLNKILNETAQQEEYPTLGGGTFDSSRMTEMLGYGSGLGNKEVKREVAAASTLQSAGMTPDTAPEHLTNALTRDYSGLMKAIDKKKGK
ncbi:hypothetical protein CMO86_07900 [Candidatus Woesearchaeota archaeon]|jgi:hypothetical protein|nr:hypothetical protein [Candidatus Woesearchaeota archaeon]|tara:strand:- start:126 stop:551 length:426 start_codon:yes stop_codon:yes gene_type:complete